MSHAYGAIKFDSDNLILHFEYNGTSDVCLPQLYKTVDEVAENWRKQVWKFHDSSCKEDEPVVMANTYGGGDYWNGKACRKCMLITDGFSLLETQHYKNTLPDWYPDRDKWL